jgi:hypothetical protein
MVPVLVVAAVSLLLLPCQAQDDKKVAFVDDAQRLFKAHGALMIIAWCIVFPLGALLAVYRDKVGRGKPLCSCFPHFYLPHVLFHGLGFLLVVLSMSLAARGCWLFWGIGNPFNNELLLNLDIEQYGWNKHVKWGIATLFLMVSYYT